MTCGYEPIVLRQLEVHHLKPLADTGPTYTSLEDVVVICSNCHRLAHNETPPLSLDEIKKRVRKSQRPSISFE